MKLFFKLFGGLFKLTTKNAFQQKKPLKQSNIQKNDMQIASLFKFRWPTLIFDWASQKCVWSRRNRSSTLPIASFSLAFRGFHFCLEVALTKLIWPPRKLLNNNQWWQRALMYRKVGWNVQLYFNSLVIFQLRTRTTACLKWMKSSSVTSRTGGIDWFRFWDPADT